MNKQYTIRNLKDIAKLLNDSFESLSDRSYHLAKLQVLSDNQKAFILTQLKEVK